MPQAKALFAAVFLQYFVQGFLYIIEGVKYKELTQENRERNIAQPKQNDVEGGTAEVEGGEDDRDQPAQLDKDPVGVDEIELEEAKNEPSGGNPFQTGAPTNARNPTTILNIDPSKYRQQEAGPAQENDEEHAMK